MKKLELKHVAPYLPYDVKFKYLSGGINLTSGKSFEDYSINVLTPHLLNCCLSRDDTKVFYDFKLILRPLSDLFKLIDWDGNNDPYMLGYKYGIEKVTQDGKLVYAEEYYADYCESPKCYIDITSFNWWLLENHFDIFELIDAGLAIDINTLNL